MTTNHIDQLNAWYEQAEPITKANLPNDGDTIIYPASVDGSYVIEGATYGWDAQAVSSNEQCRILARAPKPKPAWHNAVAIIATGDAGDGDLFTGVWVPEGSHGNWMSADTGLVLSTDQFHGVTPLIEAKVTHQMVNRILDRIDDHIDTHPARIGEEIAAAALGLETE